MKIGVLGNTHVPDILPRLPERVCDLLNGVDIILHVGDVTNLSVLQELEAIAQTFAVSGDQDTPEVKKYLQEKQRLEFANRSLGLVHGFQSWQGSWLRRTWLRLSRSRREAALREYVLREFPDVDVAVYGHSRDPYVKMHRGVLLFNPGSVLPRAGMSGTLGMLEINPSAIKGKILALT